MEMGNKMQFLIVVVSVMETKDRTKINFERRFQYQRLNDYSNAKDDFRNNLNDKFIVPWQMENKTKKEWLLD